MAARDGIEESADGQAVKQAEARLREAVELAPVEARGRALDELGNFYYRRGDLRAAAATFEQSIAVKVDGHGTEEHPDVAASLAVLGGVLEAQGNLEGARQRLERSLAINARVLGTEEHPDVAASLHLLAGVLSAQGDLAQAREKLERAMAITARVFGTEEHPSVATSLHALAGVLRAQGNLTEAREKLERALAIELKAHGTRDQFSSAMLEVELATLLLETDKEPERASEMLGHAHHVLQSLLGPEHLYTLQVAQLLGR